MHISDVIKITKVCGNNSMYNVTSLQNYKDRGCFPFEWKKQREFPVKRNWTIFPQSKCNGKVMFLLHGVAFLFLEKTGY